MGAYLLDDRFAAINDDKQILEVMAARVSGPRLSSAATHAPGQTEYGSNGNSLGCRLEKERRKK